ncbi:iron ABC transporter ATP-binding protein [Sporanaerobium hydrogeniformans]|uniref:Iron ABC transporter ATP-binding protein n=1 Tax=Sporanaerobium hydrogeniformans TaxID=3072179 RepID=A0AC61DA79_9FIRM|nr:ATP-binding cassette domain-containing protein [Sporanaerobium hydrogeniformans]PHV69452.1 iron ABC transporter ATP-binding protein [Sporanaerobium hydrogeniformans]
MIQLRNITKSYHQKKVVDDVSLTIPKGKLTSFIGPNGAGKSTLLSVMSRLIRCEEGEVMIEGQKLEEWEPKKLAKKMAVLRQSNHMSLRLTIRQLVSFGRFPHSGGRINKEDEEKIDEALNYMQLQDIQDKYLDELSGGQRQRAYIAMVLAQNSEYILLDEPLNNLDMRHSVEIMKTLKRLTQELGKTVIIVIHDINFASCYSDYIVALKDGKIAREGTSEELIEEKVLKSIYEIPFKVQHINSQRVCVYY